MLSFCYQTGFTANWAGKSITEVRVKNELTLSKARKTVCIEARDANNMTCCTRKYKNWIRQVSTGETRYFR